MVLPFLVMVSLEAFWQRGNALQLTDCLHRGCTRYVLQVSMHRQATPGCYREHVQPWAKRRQESLSAAWLSLPLTITTVLHTWLILRSFLLLAKITKIMSKGQSRPHRAQWLHYTWITLESPSWSIHSCHLDRPNKQGTEKIGQYFHYCINLGMCYKWVKRVEVQGVLLEVRHSLSELLHLKKQRYYRCFHCDHTSF